MTSRIGAYRFATRPAPGSPAAHVHVPRPATFVVLVIVFVSSMACTLSLTTLFIPVVVERGHSATTAASVPPRWV